MSNNTVPQTANIHESLRHLFYADGDFDIRQADPVPALLPDGDALWIDQHEERFEKADAIGDNFYVIRVYDLRTGEQLNAGVKLGNDWWAEQMGEFDYAHFGRFPNFYLVNEAHLFVSGGMWMTEDHPDADGMARFTSTFSLRAWEGRRRQEWLDYHSDAIDAVRPSWADDDETWVDPDNGDIVEFARTIGTVKIEQSFGVDDGILTPVGHAEIRIITGATDFGVVSSEDAARVGVDMVAAAALFGEYVTVSELRKTAVAAGVTPSVLLQMTEG
ncbi:hypothetical protein [Microbacterium testaceum]|uniref:hypothetical protein n=1 Tax=Microbacterium testaceum TaxID=2033 RepID=UPI0022E63F0B|nr:hypothetical protein [Microbacterium testaceum]